MDLFDYMRETTKEKESPLPPDCVRRLWMKWLDSSTLSERTSFLYRAIKADKLSSVIFTDLREPERLRLQR